MLARFFSSIFQRTWKMIICINLRGILKLIWEAKFYLLVELMRCFCCQHYYKYCRQPTSRCCCPDIPSVYTHNTNISYTEAWQFLHRPIHNILSTILRFIHQHTDVSILLPDHRAFPSQIMSVLGSNQPKRTGFLYPVNPCSSNSPRFEKIMSPYFES